MVRLVYAASVAILCVAALSLASDELETMMPEVVADEYYWAGPEGNVGLAITGKFTSLEAMAQILDLTAKVGRFRDRTSSFKTKDWVLRDVLISVNLNANGFVATWRVCGPKPSTNARSSS